MVEKEIIYGKESPEVAAAEKENDVLMKDDDSKGCAKIEY